MYCGVQNCTVPSEILWRVLHCVVPRRTVMQYNLTWYIAATQFYVTCSVLRNINETSATWESSNIRKNFLAHNWLLIIIISHYLFLLLHSTCLPVQQRIRIWENCSYIFLFEVIRHTGLESGVCVVSALFNFEFSKSECSTYVKRNFLYAYVLFWSNESLLFTLYSVDTGYNSHTRIYNKSKIGIALPYCRQSAQQWE